MCVFLPLLCLSVYVCVCVSFGALLRVLDCLFDCLSVCLSVCMSINCKLTTITCSLWEICCDSFYLKLERHEQKYSKHKR